VKTSRGTASSAASFNVTYPAPIISGFTPTSGGIGDAVTVNGTNLKDTTQVLFNLTSAAFSVNAAGTSITTTVPVGASSGPLRVTTSGGTAVSGSSFTVIPAPVIDSFSPAIGGVGTVVSVSGNYFGGATSVSFNGKASTFSVNAAGTLITATVPAAATTGRIVVTTAGGTATSATNFTVAPIPEIVSFSPGSGAVGTMVSIAGSRFTGTTQVKFNGVSANFVLNSDTSITTRVPVGAGTGPISVTNAAGQGTSANSFVVSASTVPNILGFSPSGGLPGASVTISGLNLSGASAVSFNGVAANFTVVSARTITATVPSARSGTLSVTTSGGTATSAAPFTVGPRITGLSPTSGSVGAFVTLTGANFEGATSVRFNGAGAAYTVVSPTQIITIVPADAVSGPISVTTLGGTANSATFTVGSAAQTMVLSSETALSSASASTGKQTITLLFTRPLAQGGADDPANYAVTVNGQPISLESVSRIDSARVELGLAESSFKVGDLLHVSWANLQDAGGALISGATGPLRAN
jgi:hypothetical protein